MHRSDLLVGETADELGHKFVDSYIVQGIDEFFGSLPSEAVRGQPSAFLLLAVGKGFGDIQNVR